MSWVYVRDGTLAEQAESEAEMLATAKRLAGEASAEATVLAYAHTGTDGPQVDRAFKHLLQDDTLTVEDLIRRLDGPGPDAANWLTGDASAVRTRPAKRKEQAAVVEGSAVEALLQQAPTNGQAAGYIRLPNLLIHGQAVARLERLAPGVGWLLVVLLRYAERKDHEVRASKATLCRLAGIRKPETLNRRLRLLTRAQKAVGIPALLRKLPGKGLHFAFRQDGLDTLAALALRTVEQEERRLATIRKRQSEGGKKGMRTRWGGGKSAPDGRAKTYVSPGGARERVSHHPRKTGRDKSPPHRG